MLGVNEARAVVRKKYQTHVATWAVNQALAAAPAAAVLELPLHPPTEDYAIANPDQALAWNDQWRTADPVSLVRVRRSWTRLGSQNLPDRLRLKTPADVAEFVGSAQHWRTISSRVAALIDQLGNTEEVVTAVRRRACGIADLDAANLTRLHEVLRWLVAHPDSGLFIRQLPIRGVDTKWLSTHRTVVKDLFTAASGRDTLGLAEPPNLIRMRILDRALLPIPVTDFSAPMRQLAKLDLRPQIVFVFENLESVIAMEPVTGAVVIHGSGYAVDRLGQIPWLRDARISYWGDLDSHGFAILNRLRHHCTNVTSVMMDVPTLMKYRDLWGTEPTPATGMMTHLTASELAALETLRDLGNVRMEQERIDWPFALEALLGETGSSELRWEEQSTGGTSSDT